MELEAVRERTARPPSGGLTPAAVLIPAIRDSCPGELLFTRRSPDLDAHPGQMSFPGGRAEAGDETLYRTALREAHEEIHLEPERVTRYGQLDPIRTVTGFEVTPFVVEIPPGPYRADPAEVAEIATIPVPAFLDPANYESERRDHPEYGEVVVHHFHVDGYTVWGATARILVQLLGITHGWSPPTPPPDG